jgi:hypothetical protein
LFGAEGDDPTDADLDGNYKRQDLLKMHAYKDAIKRSQGAYILYPGWQSQPSVFRSFFHEILPGLGAFGIAPVGGGTAKGLENIDRFVSDVLAHLANRTTVHERVTFHAAQAYNTAEGRLEYKETALPENDHWRPIERALPPVEHWIIAATYQTFEQLSWMLAHGTLVIPLEDSSDFRIPSEFGIARHVLLRSTSGDVVSGLVKIASNSHRILLAGQLAALGFPGPANAAQYAVLDVESDESFAALSWNSSTVDALTSAFVARRFGVQNLKAVPMLNLRELLSAQL